MGDEFPSGPRRLRFGVFDLDLQAGELRRRGVKVKLQEQPFRILAFLLERPGEVVTREQLRQLLWPPDTFVDFEHSINIAVKRLREALSDSADNPRFVETLPRRGYRFIAPVESLGTIPETSWERTAGRKSTIPVPEIKTMLAVLPFENLSGDPGQEYFSDGLTEEMITQLAGLNPAQLGVIARTSAMQYKHNPRVVGKIGQELGVDYVLEGSVRRQDNRIRVSAQLIRVSNQAHLWAASYDRALGGILALQSEVARAIADEIQVRLTPQKHTSLASVGPIDPDAYEAYLEGRYYWNKRTVDDLWKAVQHFQRATRLAPEYGPAHAGLSDVYAFLPAVAGGITTPPSVAQGPEKEISRLARKAALRALEIDDTLSEAHTSMGAVKAYHDWDWQGAEAEFKRSIELNPRSSEAHRQYGCYLSVIGHHRGAIAETELARKLDPLSLNANNDLGMAYCFARQYDRAIEQLHRTLELEPKFFRSYLYLAATHIPMQKYEEAFAELQKAEAAPEIMAYGLAFTGRKAQARKMLAEAIGTRVREIGGIFVALCYDALAERGRAIEWLEKAYCNRQWHVPWLKAFPPLDPMRSDPRFQDLLRRMNFPPRPAFQDERER
ncbi:MAG: winged helix-turn-helix domain-containing protein [Acidobacteriota bacterium]